MVRDVNKLRLGVNTSGGKWSLTLVINGDANGPLITQLQEESSPKKTLNSFRKLCFFTQGLSKNYTTYTHPIKKSPHPRRKISWF